MWGTGCAALLRRVTAPCRETKVLGDQERTWHAKRSCRALQGATHFISYGVLYTNESTGQGSATALIPAKKDTTVQLA